MTVTATQTPGQLRVVFDPAQRELAIDELQIQRDVLKGTEGAPASTSGTQDERLRAIESALDEAAGTEPGKPFEISAPAWLIRVWVRGATSLAVHRVEAAIDNEAPDLPNKLEAARTWCSTLLVLTDPDGTHGWRRRDAGLRR